MSKHPRHKKIKKSNNYLKVGDIIYFVKNNIGTYLLSFKITHPDEYKMSMTRQIKDMYRNFDNDIVLNLGGANQKMNINLYSRTLDGPELTDKDFNI